MSVLFFFPWVSTQVPLQLGSLSLIPFVRGQAPGELHGIYQATVDVILSNYGDLAFPPEPSPFTHVHQATLITWENDVDGLILSEDQVFDRLMQTRYIAFSALAQRRFCSHFAYCNSDGYEVVAQGFTAERPEAISITTRRRDGSTQHLISRTFSPRLIRPDHVDSRLALAVDADLVCALLALPPGDLKCRIDESIEAFLRANTDSPAMQGRAEMVLMRVAFETLLDATHEASDLRKRVGAHFMSELPNPPTWGNGQLTEAHWRQRWPSNVTRPLDAWVQDFCDARNSAAHGPRGTRAPSLWHRRNHLLFSSWLFPLMVKKTLADEGLYELSNEDRAARQGCEAFLAYDVLSRTSEEADECWWSRIEGEILLPVLADALFSRS